MFLKIDKAKLDSFKHKLIPGSTEKKSLYDVLLTYYMHSESDHSWSTIVDCLRSTDVGCPEIADDIEKKYVTASANINGKNMHHIIIMIL